MGDDKGTSSKTQETNEDQSATQAAGGASGGMNFRKIPELGLVFRRDDDRTSRATTCMMCSKVIKTHETDRLIRHVIKCSEVDKKTRDLLVSKFKCISENRSSDVSHNKKINLLFCESFIRLGISFSSVDEPMFREAIKMLNPTFKLATKEELLSLVPQLGDGVYKTIKTKQVIMLQQVHLQNDMYKL